METTMTPMRLSPKKRGAPLGQHFLTSRAIATTIARESGAKEGSTILEVGPGKGVLTQELLALGARVVAIEKDSAMIAILHELFAKEIASHALSIIEGDARDLLTKDFEALKLPKTYAVAANIPYYITGELIRLFLTASVQPENIILLVQKEVAERIARTKKESLLSLSVKAYGMPRYIKTVKAGSFNPPPKVDSAIFAIEKISRENFITIPEESFFELLHAGFGQKRKTLLGNVKRFYGQEVSDWETIWRELNLGTNVRAEDVPLDRWLFLTKALERESNTHLS